MFDLPIRQLFKENVHFIFNADEAFFRKTSYYPWQQVIIWFYFRMAILNALKHPLIERTTTKTGWKQHIFQGWVCFPALLAVNAKCASRTSRPQPLKRITAKMSKACFRRLLHLLPGRQKVKVHARHTHTKKPRNNVQVKVCTACTKVLANALLSLQPSSKECGPPFAPLGSSSSQL